MLSLDLATTFENNKMPINGSGIGPNAEHESSTMRSTAVTARYVLSPRLSVMMSLPYREIHSPKDVGGLAAKHIERSFRGLGDTILLGRYRLDTNTRGPQWHGLLGLRLPTGPANPNHNWIAADGSTILSRDPVLQPGFGTLDPIIGFQWMRPQPGGRSFFAGTLWRPSVMLNRYGYKWGNELQATVGANLPLSRDFTFRPQFFGQFSGRDREYQPLPGRQQGIVRNTGGHWIYFMPNLRYRAFELNVQVPVYRHTNGGILNPNLVLGVRTNFDLALRSRARIAPTRGDFRVISRGERIDYEQAATKGKLTLVEFADRNCKGCQELTPQLQTLLDQRPDIALRQVEVTDAGCGARSQERITAMPVFVMLDKTGARVNAQPCDYAGVQQLLDRQTEADAEMLVKNLRVISRSERVQLSDHLVAGKVTIFQFFTPTCDAVRSIASALCHLAATDPAVAVKRIEVSDEKSAVVAQHRIEVTPTFIVYGPNGQCAGRQASADYPALAKLIQRANVMR